MADTSRRGRPSLSYAELLRTIDLLKQHNGDKNVTAEALGICRKDLNYRLREFEKRNHHDAPFRIEHAPPVGSDRHQSRWELESLPNNTFRFAAMGDLHAGSKYCRWDVRQDLMKRAEKFKAQVLFDTGNWIDGTKPFNIHDLEAVGLESQAQHLAKHYPRIKVPTYAVAGADHEGWYVKSEGVDVGKYVEREMRAQGHDWTNLGYMEADVLLKNKNSGKKALLRVMHPGGGSAYANSYRPQKIIESLEGGEKPAICLMGHYHKLDFGVIRNVWYVQCGCTQDQTPFLRQKSIQVHIGGFLIECEQDPETGAIIAFRPEMRVYYNEAWYFQEGRGNNRWGAGKVSQPPRKLMRTSARP